MESLSVYSRWGEKMFITKGISLNDPNAGWDGTYRGKPVSPGVYVWQAEVIFLDGQRQRYAGDVTVIR
jgi:large repetitive protein